MRCLIFSGLLLLLASCSGVSMISRGDKSDLYSDEFLQKIGSIKELYRQGKGDEAIKALNAIDENTLLPTEKALRRNLVGVVLFAQKNYERAIFNFDLALTTSKLDPSLNAQIHLNLASSYFKLGFFDKAYATLSLCEYKQLNENEEKKFHKLNYTLSKELGREDTQLTSLILYLKDKQKISDLKSDPYFEYLVSAFFKLNDRSKLELLEDFEDTPYLVVGYLGYLEVEKLFYKAQKESAKDLLSWVEKKFESNAEVSGLVRNFLYRVEHYAKMDPLSIGVILPLTGDKEGFSKRALMGIDNALRFLKNEKSRDYKLHVKDSQGSGAVGAFKVKELLEKHYVSVIIGGLFSSEAKKEYLEAKKHGVFFISLSQVYLPKEQKDHLLLEIPGSVESQVNRLFSKEALDYFGRRAAILYPRSDRGEAYVSEFWRKSQVMGVEVTGVHSYDQNKTDYRIPVKNILGLQFPRERQEELELLSSIHSLQKRSSRRIQDLKPQIDFDWVFIPALPTEALQLIPSFTYYDAFNMTLVGGPSWRSKRLSKESYKFGKMYFIGNDVDASEEVFIQKFIERYQKRPRLIEMQGHDAFKVADTLLSSDDYETRDELDMAIRSYKKINGVTGQWTLSEGIWLKEMVPLRLRSGRIENVLKAASQGQ